MTVTTTANTVVYLGNGATTEFAVPFKVIDEDHIVVSKRLADTGVIEEVYVGTDYTFDGLGDSAGTLTLSGDPLDDDYELVIERVVPYKQELDIVNASGFYPETVEEQLDLFAMQIQQIASMAQRSIRVPVGTTLDDTPLPADLAGKFLSFDAEGNPLGASGTGADGSLREDVADPDQGGRLIGYKRSSSAILRSFYTAANDTLPLTAYHLGDGTSATTALAAAIADAISEGKRLIMPRAGHFLLTNAPLATAGLVIEGDGETSRFTVGANNSNIFTLSGDRITLKGMKLEGDDTSSSSANGNAILLTGADALIEDVWFTGFGHGALRASSGTTKRGPRIIRARVRDQGANGHDFYLSGGWQDSLFEDLDCVNTGTADQAIGFFEEGTAYWNGIEVRGGWFEGYALWGIAVADETWDGTDRVYGLTINKGYYKNCGQAGIKAKLSKGILVDGARLDGCGDTLENGPSGLYGAILINSIGQIMVNSTTIRDAGHGGIVFNGNDGPPKGYPQGQGLPSVIISHNIIEGVTSPTAGYGNGIVGLGRMKSVHLVHNDVRDAARHGIYLNGAQKNGIKHVVSQGNFVGHSASTEYGCRFVNIDTLKVDGDEVTDYGGIAASFETIYSTSVGASVRYHDSRSAVAVAIVVNVTRFMFDGAANCSLYPAWAATTAYVEGDRVSLGGNAYECTVAGTSAGAGGPTGTAPAVEVTDGTAKWAYIHKHRQNTVGLAFSGTAPEVCRIGATADFAYITSTPTSGAPSNTRWANIMTGTSTMPGAGTLLVSLFPSQQDADYKIGYSCSAAETISFSGKAVDGFTINSSNGTSTAKVDWFIYR